jgi:predicted amidophosphoribosyltransferase
MQKINCNECGEEVSVHADACQCCQAPIDEIKAYNAFNIKFKQESSKYWIVTETLQTQKLVAVSR